MESVSYNFNGDSVQLLFVAKEGKQGGAGGNISRHAVLLFNL